MSSKQQKTAKRLEARRQAFDQIKDTTSPNGKPKYHRPGSRKK